MNLILRFVFDRKNTATDKTKGLLQIEVRQKGTSKRVFVSTGIKLTKNQFSDKNGFACKNHPNAPSLTGKGHKIFREIEAFVLSDKCRSIEDVKNWDKNESETLSFLDFIETELKKRNPSFSTIEHTMVLVRQLRGFGKIKVFSDLTYENISDFDAHLRKTITTTSTLNKRHSTLRRYIKEAVNRDLIKKDPYNSFKMPSKKSKDPTFLEEHEIEKIKNYKPVNEKLSNIKDLFLFQIFTGLAYVDLQNFNKLYIYEMDGSRIIRSNRTKTDESFISLFLPEAEEIAEKYNYELPKISNQKYNDYLKLLGAGADLTKTLTSHVARHTFATYLLNRGIPIETVSKAMGHSNIKQTQHYAKLLGKKVISDMKTLIKPDNTK